MAIDASEELVRPPRLIIHHIMFDKAKLAGVVAVAVPDALLYGFVLVEQDLGDVQVASVRSRDFQTVFRHLFLLC